MNDLIFAPEPEDTHLGEQWEVLIVDDEPSIHSVTKAVLKDQQIEGRTINFTSAYSGREAIEILKERNDIAVIFLDVVMESNNAGLETCRRIREELGNDLVRIILRTGQPGSAPENEVIIKYRINDYKEKTDLTSAKLFSCVVTALRSYQDLQNLEQNKEGLRKVIEATKNISESKSIEIFLEGILAQLMFILDTTQSLEKRERSQCFTFEQRSGGPIKPLTDGSDAPELSSLTEEVQLQVQKAFSEQRHLFEDNIFCGYFHFGKDRAYVFCIQSNHPLDELECSLLRIFSGNIEIALDNLFLNQDIINTQTELIEKLGEVVEKRSSEASKHVQRVADFSYMLAKDYGLAEQDAQILRAASPMHDVGKIGIPDAVLLKPGKLTEDEFELMKTHTEIGYAIFEHSERKLLKTAALISRDHHEKYNGKGYPSGKKGDDIHVYGRITAVADVFDALYHARCYKPAWPLEDIVQLLKDERGEHFDPDLVDIVLNNLDRYVAITKVV